MVAWVNGVQGPSYFDTTNTSWNGQWTPPTPRPWPPHGWEWGQANGTGSNGQSDVFGNNDSYNYPLWNVSGFNDSNGNGDTTDNTDGSTTTVSWTDGNTAQLDTLALNGGPVNLIDPGYPVTDSFDQST